MIDQSKEVGENKIEGRSGKQKFQFQSKQSRVVGLGNLGSSEAFYKPSH